MYPTDDHSPIKSVNGNFSNLQTQYSQLQYTPSQQYNTMKKFMNHSPHLKQSMSQEQMNNYKDIKARELEEKVDLILTHNSQLLQEKEQYMKLFNQKKTEAEIWKQKYEAQMNQAIQNKANQEIFSQQVQHENDNLRQQLEQYEYRQNQFSQIQEGQQKNDNLLELDQIKKQHLESTNLYEEQLRKLKDMIEDKDKENNELSFRLNNEREQSEQKIVHLAQEKEDLKLKLQTLDLEVQSQLDEQKLRNDQIAQEAMENLKQLHLQELEILNTELQKLKDLLRLKNQEIQDLINQGTKSKKNFKNDENSFKNEIQNLKQKLLEVNKQKNHEINELAEKLDNLHKSDIQTMKLNHNNQMYNKEKEIEQLKALIKQKSDEIELLNFEKLRQADELQAAFEKLHKENSDQQAENSLIIQNLTDQLNNLNHKTQQNSIKHTEQINQNLNQISFLENEIDKLKTQIVQKNNENDTIIQQANAQKSNLEEDIRNLKGSIEQLKIQLKTQEIYNNQIINELQQKNYNLEANSSQKYRELQINYDFIASENRKFQDALQNQQEQLDNTLGQKQNFEIDQKKLRLEIENLNRYILEIEARKASEIKLIRQKIEESNRETIKEIQQTHQNKINMLQEEYQDLEAKLAEKEEKLNELSGNYNQILLSGINTKDPNINTYKNIYDIYQQSKQFYQNN